MLLQPPSVKPYREYPAIRPVGETLYPHAEELIASLPMGILFTDRDNRVGYLNAALGRLLGRVDVEDILDVIFREFCIGK